jgi:streptogramin lyase
MSIKDGKITDYSVPTADAGLNDIVVGPDGNLWFTESDGNKIGKIYPATGNITEYIIPPFFLPEGAYPTDIVSGPDGNLWFSEAAQNQIGKISPATGVITEYHTTGFSGSITADSDGNLWFLESNKISSISPSTGDITDYIIPTETNAPPGGQTDLTTDPDGNLWFTDINKNIIGKLSPTTGIFTEYSIPLRNVTEYPATISHQ